MSETAGYDIPDGTPGSIRELLYAVREGRAEDVPKLLGALTDAERRAGVPVFTSWRRTTRNNWEYGHVAIRKALLVAGAGCRTGAAAAAQWLAAGDLRWAGVDHTLVLDALGDRTPEWLGQVAYRLAERRTAAEEMYPLVAGLVRAAGCEPPTTDGVVLGWERNVHLLGTTIRDRLRDDPFLAVMVPRLFEVPEAGSDLLHTRPEDPGWAEALVGLAEEGRLSREMLVDGCLSRLLRGGRLGIVKGFLALLTSLDLTEDERADRTLTWVRMMPDAHALVAARAQEVLAGLDEAGRLQTEHLAEASRAALFRPEKKIVRAQLSLLDKAMKRDRSRTDELLSAAAEAFGHPEHSLQERALALVARHRGHAGGAVLAELAEAARQLAPDLRERAAAAFGEPVVVEEDDAPATEGDTLPSAPGAERLGTTPLSDAELAEEVSVLLHRGGTPAQWERALNGLVVRAHDDLAGLRAALEPVVAQRRPETWEGTLNVQGLEFVVLSVMGRVSEKDMAFIRYRALEHQCPHSAVRSVPLARGAEIAARLGDGDPLPFLLATPTWSTGSIDPSELVDRLAAYERSGTAPGRADFEQALLRLAREIPTEAREAAARLTSPAGRRLADWLASGGLPDPVVSRGPERLRLRSPRPGVLVRTGAIAGNEEFSEPFRSLTGTHDPIAEPCRCRGGGECTAHVLAILPGHREISAGKMLVTFAALAQDGDLREVASVLPVLAESGGPAGPATHLLLAHGLGARGFEEQLYAVDALLVLAARGQLNASQLAQDIVELTRLGRLKPQRVVAALREAMRTGAYGTVWSVLAAAIPLLLTGDVPHSMPAVLTIAAECAERSGARGAIPEVNELAARSGSSQLVKQARRIKAATERPAAEA